MSSDSTLNAEDVAEEGEPDRAFLGIDGTMGDAQDVTHPFLGSVDGSHCRVCGLAKSYRKHACEHGWNDGSCPACDITLIDGLACDDQAN